MRIKLKKTTKNMQHITAHPGWMFLLFCCILLLSLNMRLEIGASHSSILNLGMGLALCAGAGVLLGVAAQVLVGRLSRMRLTATTGVIGFLVVLACCGTGIIRLFHLRLSAALPILFVSLIAEGLIFGSTRSDRVRVREGLIAFFTASVFLIVLSAAAEAVVLCLCMLVLAASCLKERSNMLVLLTVLAAVGVIGLLAAWICWNIVTGSTAEAPKLVRMLSTLYIRFRSAVEVYLNPAGANVYTNGYQIHRVRLALDGAQLLGPSRAAVEIPQAYSVCAFTTFVATYGLIPAATVLALLPALFRRTAAAAVHAAERREGTVALALGSGLVLSGLLSAAANAGLVPLMGFSFPVLSASGQYLLLSLAILVYLSRVQLGDRKTDEPTPMERRTDRIWVTITAAAALILLRLVLHAF